MAAMYQYRPVWAEIDTSALKQNIEVVKSRLSSGTSLMAVVKADAYGHEAALIAPAVLEAGAEWLGVASAEEGISLRKSNIEAPILILSEIIPSASKAAILHRLTPTVCSVDFAIALDRESAAQDRVTSVHVKVDTGMNRLGVKSDEAVPFIEALQKLPNIKIAGLFTHFATADEDDDSFLREQLAMFNNVIDRVRGLGLEPLVHAANSAAALKLKESHFDLVRIGIAMYGLEPFPGARIRCGLKPVMSLKSKITAIKKINTGETVSYGRTFKAGKPMRIGLIPIGYADGVNRRLSNKGEVCIEGKRAQILGRVCMDQMLADVSDIAEAGVGSEVAIIGAQDAASITIEEIASIVGTINYEIACGVNHRVPRRVL